MKTRLILKSFQSPGDIVMLTAAVRDLHRAFPSEYETDVRTSSPDLWDNNPYLVSLDEHDSSVRSISMHYPLIHQSNQLPYHFIHGYIQYLESQLDRRIPITEFRGDIHLSQAERNRPESLGGTTIPRRYWIIIAGGKYDFTAKWWNPNSYQAVVDHFSRDISFVQCGEAGHWHPPLRDATNLVGKTSLRELVWLIHHADGVICPVTLAMHLAAAVEPPASRRWKSRPCIVVAGGREPPSWEAYPGHRHLSTVGTLSCCSEGGCWKSRCQQVGDGDAKDRTNRCEQPIVISESLMIPRCMELISADDVIRNVSLYLNGDLGSAEREPSPTSTVRPLSSTQRKQGPEPAKRRRFCLNVAGRAQELVPLGIVVNHLRHYYPQCEIALSGVDRSDEWRNILGLDSDSNSDITSPTVHRLNGAIPHVISAGMPRTPARRWLIDELHLSPIEDLSNVDLSSSELVSQRWLDVLQMPGGGSAQEQRPVVAWLEEFDAGEESTSSELREAVLSQLGGIFVHLRVSENAQTEGIACASAVDGVVEEHKVILPTLSDLLATISQLTAVVTCDSALGSLALAVRTPTVCLWEKHDPRHVLEPNSLATHLVAAGGDDGVSTLVKSPYRVRPTEAPTEEILNVLRELIDTPSREDGLGMPLGDSEPLVVKETASPSISPTTTDDDKQQAATDIAVKKQSFTSVEFMHGLGDAANFARLIPLYVRRGHELGVRCTQDKEILFRAAGATIVDKVDYVHPWGYPPDGVRAAHDGEFAGHKAAWNISEYPLPNIGDKEQLWSEYCASEVRVASLVPAKDRELIQSWLAPLPRPITLLHTKGNTAQSVKSLPDHVTAQFYREFLDRTEGSLVLLDWDNRIPRLATYRVRHLQDLSGGCSTERMFALMEEADLMIGVDSGPLHAAGLTDTPRVGVWMPGHYPARYTLPDARQLNLVLEGRTREWNRYRRVPWNIVEQPGNDWDAAWLAEQAVQMLATREYLSNAQAGADVQLQHWIKTLCRGDRRQLTATYTDRNRSFDKLLREATRRFTKPMFVETGTVRAEEDWSGAGFSTYLFGLYLKHVEGTLHTVDLSPSHCEFASTWTRVYGDTVHVHQQDSVTFLKNFGKSIDVLYLDSLDTTEPRHAEHAQHEVLAALPWLHDRSLILFDDTPWRDGAFVGKGARAVPWLLDHGWKILFAGYQVLLEKETA